MNLNKVFLVGRLTQNPDTKTLASGQLVCTFGLATNRVWTNQETKQKQEKAEFHNIVLWRRLAEIASQYLSKGSLVLIEGRIQTRSWEDTSGNKRYRTEVVADNIQLGPRAASFQTTSPEPSVPNQNQPQKETSQEDIPIIEEGKEEEPSSVEGPQPNLATNRPEDKDQDNEEIDVSQIPF